MSQTQRSITISWDDPMAAFAASKGLSGLQYMEKLIAGEITPPPIMKLIGYALLEVAKGHAVFGTTPAEQHYNPIGVVHGGIAMTLLDSAMGCAVHTLLPRGMGYCYQLIDEKCIGSKGAQRVNYKHHQKNNQLFALHFCSLFEFQYR